MGRIKRSFSDINQRDHPKKNLGKEKETENIREENEIANKAKVWYII